MLENNEAATPQQDWFLAALVQILNSLKGASMGITLHVGGLVVSGQLASGAQYLEETGQTLDKALTGGTSDRLSKLFQRTAGTLYSEENQTVGYVHLRNVRFFQPGAGALPLKTQAWWRGRLSHVSGFSIGEMESN